ncbi:hypothetical protein [Sphingopyxis sp.]|uniref:hypothetical protein n=1 Tax=Sphingopyxis sp. TaxID=1908224 RepID=UPI003BAB1348
MTAIIEGRQPATLTAKLLPANDLPMLWQEQRRALGFSPTADCSQEIARPRPGFFWPGDNSETEGVWLLAQIGGAQVA